MADVDIEKTKSDTLLAEEIKKSQNRMDKFEEDKKKTNADVLEMSEWKTSEEAKWKDLDTKFEKLDTTIKNSLRPEISDKEKALTESKDFEKTLRYAGMTKASHQKFDSIDSYKPESEEKAMQVNNDVRAGYLQTPPEFFMEIIDQVAHDFSPVRRVAKVSTTSSNRIQIPSKTGRGQASWLQESETDTEDTNLTFGLEDIPTHDGRAMAVVTYQMLRDSAFNLQGYITDEYKEGFGVLEGTAHVTGTGIGQPEGLMTNGDISSTNSGNASNITADAFKTVLFAQKEKYSINLNWLMRRATLGVVSVTKGGDGQYLIGNLGEAPTYFIQGIPVLQDPNMPAIAADAYPVLLGDFSNYRIVDQIGSSIAIVDPYTSATTGQIRYFWFWSTGGQVTNAEAFRKMKVSA